VTGRVLGTKTCGFRSIGAPGTLSGPKRSAHAYVRSSRLTTALDTILADFAEIYGYDVSDDPSRPGSAEAAGDDAFAR